MGIALAMAGDEQAPKSKVDAILERKMSFNSAEEATPTLKELDAISNDPQFTTAQKYRAARASYQVRSYLFLYEDALKSARTALEFVATEEERADSTLALAQTFLRKSEIAKDESEIREACENAFAALDNYIEYAKKEIPVTEIFQGKTVAVLLDPYQYIFRHINLLSSFSKYLSSVNDPAGAWTKTADALTMFRTYSKQIYEQGSFPGFEDALHFQHFHNSIAIENYDAASAIILWAFNHETLSEKEPVAMLEYLARQMVEDRKLTAANMFPSNLPLKDDPMIAFLFRSTSAKTFYEQGKYTDAIELTKQNLDFVSKRMEEASNANNKALLEEMQKTQLEMLGLLNSCYVKTGNLDAARAVGGVMRLLQEKKDSPDSRKGR